MTFFSERTTSHTKNVTTQISGDPVFDTHLELLKLALTFCRLNIPNLEILKIEDIPGISFNSIMSFHNDVSILVN